MARNIELKAGVDDLEAARRAAIELGAVLHSVERQRDTYFRVATGRLKLRRRWIEAQPVVSELIFYQRPDAATARGSDYMLLPIANGDALLGMLAAALGVLVEVNKTRTVYLHDNVRIHLDAVDGLGSYLEFEAIVDARCDDAGARAKIDRLQNYFRLAATQILQSSYSDMLLRR
jgi:predicted adenylyl cyclase CyaB